MTNALPPYSNPPALAEADACLWDINAKAADLPLYKYLGAYRHKTRAYASTVAYATIDGYLDAIRAAASLRAERTDGLRRVWPAHAGKLKPRTSSLPLPIPERVRSGKQHRSPAQRVRALDPLDTWLAQAFAPHRIEQSLTALEDAQPDDAPALEAAQRAIAECDRKLARHRAALEAGADPALVVAWSHQVHQQRMIAEARLATLASRHGTNRSDEPRRHPRAGGHPRWLAERLVPRRPSRQSRGLPRTRRPPHLRPRRTHRTGRNPTNIIRVRSVCVRGGT